MAIQGLQNASIRERQTLDQTGNLVNEVVITVLTDMGNSGTIIIPAALYQRLTGNPDDLANLIVGKINELDAVHLL